MATTPNWGLEYPASSDTPAGHTQIQALAEDVESALDSLPVITYGTGDPPSSGMKVGDVYLKHA